MIQKLKSGRGESLLETLLSVLIAALAILMFSNIIAATIRSTTHEKSWTDDVNQKNKFLEERKSIASLPDWARTTSGTITVATEDGTKKLIDDVTSVSFYICNYGGREDVISYDVPSP